ncbi:hypothetical protein [Nocardia cerradoensis]|uniref:Mce-associated membrane protein n=1 Tax=Nocardia cerradoensis TaxID=85688 RepID=A0A231H572_9NOCA|nr:hypothetical protein [Nocardia cerradoensis]NKY46460.1 hypothetical protein [Nocardia cerradoensis]OXR43876.1 hypothetical protein B7C42_04115 [Nocardia cerradoensis]
MASRPPINKVSPRLKPGDRSSESAERTIRRRGGADRTASRAKSAKPAGKSANTASRTRTVRAGAATTRPAPVARPSRKLPRPGRLPRRVSAGWGLTAGLIVASVLLTAFAVVAALEPGVDNGNKAFVDTKATQEVTAAADNALKTVYSYDVKTVGGYKDAVHKVVTGKMRGDFDKFADTTVSAIQQAQSTAQATPDPIGVTLLTDDRAELLVNLTVSATKNGAPQESASGPIVLHMQKVDGHWLASEIADR